MPAQKPGKSKQNYTTPIEFVNAVFRRSGIDHFDADLAASDENALAYPYFTEMQSAFDAPTWRLGDGWNWLNPPFLDIAPWVERALKETEQNAHTLVLIPASVGANWWRDFVHEKADVVLLNGRLTFGGVPPNPRTGRPDPYPKDCALLMYTAASVAVHGSYTLWEWMKQR